MSLLPGSGPVALVVVRIEQIVRTRLASPRARWAAAGIAVLVVLTGLGLATSGAATPVPPAWAAGTATAGLTLAGGAAGEPSLLELGGKAAFVIILLVITLQLLRRSQRVGRQAGALLVVLESRPLAAKATMHLVAIGDRRLVIGHTPNGLVALAELTADELPDPLLSAERAAVDLPGGPSFASTLAALTGRGARRDAPR